MTKSRRLLPSSRQLSSFISCAPQSLGALPQGRADSNSANAVSFLHTHNKMLSVAATVVSIVRSIGGYKPPFPVPETQSVFHLLAHNETLSVVAMRVCNPDCSASLAHADRVKIVLDCRTANDQPPDVINDSCACFMELRPRKEMAMTVGGSVPW